MQILSKSLFLILLLNTAAYSQSEVHSGKIYFNLGISSSFETGLIPGLYSSIGFYMSENISTEMGLFFSPITGGIGLSIDMGISFNTIRCEVQVLYYHQLSSTGNLAFVNYFSVTPGFSFSLEEYTFAAGLPFLLDTKKIRWRTYDYSDEWEYPLINYGFTYSLYILRNLAVD